MKAYRNLLVMMLFVSVSINTFAQKNKLLQSRTTSELTYIYEISEGEALNIIKNKPQHIDSIYFHTLVKTYKTDSIQKLILEKGKHYLKTYTILNKQMIEYAYIPSFDIMIIDNNTDLCLQLYDLQGNIIENAIVKIGNKKLKLDKKTHCYLDIKSNRKGIVSVIYNGNTTYFDLNKSYNYDPFHQTMIGIFYRSPLKYAWLPIDFTMRIPADLYYTTKSSFRYNRWSPNGTIYRTQNFFSRLFTPRDNYYRRSTSQGYFVFNKPKYKPNDTVKFKAFLVDKKGKPLKKEVKVLLQKNYDYKTNKILTTLKPYRPGAYEFSFFLHDSLNLKLDDNYSISLIDKKTDDEIDGGRFFYEEYELNNTKLTVNTSSDKQYKGKPFKFYAKGTDENDLNLMDARLEISAVTNSVINYQEDKTIIPDTLWKFNQNLKPTGETEISVPDSIFPKASLMYALKVKLLTSDNKTFTETKNIKYYDSLNETLLSLAKDSLKIETFRNGEPTKEDIALFASDNFGNKTLIGHYTTPAKTPLNVYYSSYIAKNGNIETSYNVGQQSSQLQSYTSRTNDSILIDINNPRNLKFVYYVYEQNKEKFRGSNSKLSIHNKTNSKKNYYLTINYLWGGEIKNETYRIPHLNKQLNIEVKQPKIIYPGQKTNVDILVTDTKGKPVENVDLTAFSLTKKFNYSAPSLPYLGKSMPEKALINKFRINNKNNYSTSQILDYKKWSKLANLDSIEYYKFIYPQDKIYKIEYEISDKQTQFAPFVINKDGSFDPIHIISVDNKPIYFSWNTTIQPYSFAVESGVHQVELRTSSKKIIIPHIYFVRARKTIFSLKNDFGTKSDFNTQKAQSKLTQQEQNWANAFIFPYKNNFGENIAYIKNDNVISMLNPSNNSYNQLAGPVMGDVKLNVMNGYSMDFRHEPYFEYEFSDKIIKMRDRNSTYFPTYNYLSSTNAVTSLNDTILTKKILENQYKLFLEKKRLSQIRYYNPTKTESGFGKILIENVYPKNINSIKKPLNIVVLNKNDFEYIRVYPGSANIIHQLDEGNYKIVFFYADSYYAESQIDVKKNATSYLRIKYPVELKKDAYSEKINYYIESSIKRNNPNPYMEKVEINDIKNQFLMQNQYTGEGYLISGKIIDKTNEPLIGVTITVKNSNLGTVSDMDGNFTIKVPYDKNTLEVRYIGFKSKEINIFGSESLNQIILEEDEKRLEEVVVVGYGTVMKRELTGAVSGVISTAGSSYDVRIRGISSVNPNAQPLYIIDGQIFTGNISSLYSDGISEMEIIKDASATAIYGARASNGVVVISTKNKKFASSSLNKGADFDESFLQSASSANNLRSNFSDYAFWQPRLTTDKNGTASFETTFPDDVTSWQTYVLAMNDKKQTGQTSLQTKSYKPLMAQLAVPNFLVKNDKVSVIGKSLNYLPDSLRITNNFEINGKSVFNQSRKIGNSIIDSLQMEVSQDSISLLYSLKKDDGYFDGEKHNVPVFPIGLEETTGSFYTLDKDTVISPEFDKNIRDVKLYADVDELEFLKSDLAKLIHYKYWCNEQIASKLKALLADKLICKYKGETFKDEAEIKKMIKLLLKNRKQNDLWGWWQDSPNINIPFSTHILEALQSAKNQGYEVNLDLDELAKKAIQGLESNAKINSINLLKILKSLNAVIDYKKYINHFDSMKIRNLNDKLSLMELKQMCGVTFSLDSLYKYKQTTMFGNVFFKDSKIQSRGYFSYDIINTLTAYRILRNQNPTDETLNKIRYYLFNTKKDSYWNTYETAKIAETILPDMLKQNKKFEKSTLKIEGTVTKTTDKFPYELKLTSEDKINITKTGNQPMYLTVYQHYWNENPIVKSGDFVIKSRFSTNSNILLQGKDVKLIVDLEVKKDADYVMITVPIPAGCSYGTKGQYYLNEVHREYFKNETNIFCEKLRAGNYSFEINLTPRFSGTYTLNPAKAELMYFPTFNANNEIKKVSIK